MRSRHPLRLVAVVCALAALWGAARAGQVRVTVANNLFNPRTVNINPGDQVGWVWAGNFHTVTSGDSSAGTWDGQFFHTSVLSGSGATAPAFSWKSGSARTIPYFCEVHAPLMAARVIVGSGAVADFRITEVQYNIAGGQDLIEITNNGTANGNFGRYRIGVGAALVAIPVADIAVTGNGMGRVVIHVNASGTNTATDIFLPTLPELPASGSVTVLMPNTENTGVTADQVVDYVEWGAAAQPNEAVAAAAGDWVTGEFIPPAGPGHSYELCQFSPRSANSWAEIASPNFGGYGDCTTPSGNTSWGRIKSLYR